MVRVAILAAASMAAVFAASQSQAAAESYSRGEGGPPVGRGPGKGHKQAARKIKAKGGPKRKPKGRTPRPSKTSR